MFKAKNKTKQPENEQKAYEYAVFLLSLQLRTVGEVRSKMEGRGYSPAVIENVTEQLRKQRYLDDERYAEVFLENLKQYKNLGYYGIKKKFMLKKLPANIIERTLADGLSVEEELKIAKRLLKKEGVAAASSDSDNNQVADNSYAIFSEDQSKQKQKITQKLRVRGFRGEVIARLVY